MCRALASHRVRAQGQQQRQAPIGHALASQWGRARGPQQRRVTMRIAAVLRRSGKGHKTHDKEKRQCDWPRFWATVGHGSGNAIGRALVPQWAGAQGSPTKNGPWDRPRSGVTWIIAHGPQQRPVPVRLAARWRPIWSGTAAHNKEQCQCDVPRFGVAVSQRRRLTQGSVAVGMSTLGRRVRSSRAAHSNQQWQRDGPRFGVTARQSARPKRHCDWSNFGVALGHGTMPTATKPMRLAAPERRVIAPCPQKRKTATRSVELWRQ
jgi:hypothetical protein